jgi:hypothetical protein
LWMTATDTKSMKFIVVVAGYAGQFPTL